MGGDEGGGHWKGGWIFFFGLGGRRDVIFHHRVARTDITRTRGATSVGDLTSQARARVVSN